MAYQKSVSLLLLDLDEITRRLGSIEHDLRASADEGESRHLAYLAVTAAADQIDLARYYLSGLVDEEQAKVSAVIRRPR